MAIWNFFSHGLEYGVVIVKSFNEQSRKEGVRSLARANFQNSIQIHAIKQDIGSFDLLIMRGQATCGEKSLQMKTRPVGEPKKNWTLSDINTTLSKSERRDDRYISTTQCATVRLLPRFIFYFILFLHIKVVEKHEASICSVCQVDHLTAEPSPNCHVRYRTRREYHTTHC